MSELQRLKGLLPPELQSWVFVEAAASVEPPLITIEEIGRDEVEIQVDLSRQQRQLRGVASCVRDVHHEHARPAL